MPTTKSRLLKGGFFVDALCIPLNYGWNSLARRLTETVGQR